MFKWQDVPMEKLDDVIAWHRHQLDLAKARQSSRAQHPQAKTLPRFTAKKIHEDQKKIDFHSQVLGILKPLAEKIVRLEDRNRQLEHAELLTQAALL